MALLRAVGFTKARLRFLAFAEHAGLLAGGLACGTVAAVVAVLPALLAPGAKVPYASLALTLVAVAASGLLWTRIACSLALRSPLLAALREE
jgi:hypothetical protein